MVEKTEAIREFVEENGQPFYVTCRSTEHGQVITTLMTEEGYGLSVVTDEDMLVGLEPPVEFNAGAELLKVEDTLTDGVKLTFTPDEEFTEEVQFVDIHECVIEVKC